MPVWLAAVLIAILLLCMAASIVIAVQCIKELRR